MSEPSKKTVAIISSLHNSINYGAILQSYALVYVVNHLGYEACQLSFDPHEYNSSQNNEMDISRAIHFVLSHDPMKTAAYIRTTLFQRKHKAEFTKSVTCAKRFVKQQIKTTPPLKPQNISEITEMYDIFICGSDQIWNPNWFAQEWYLSFAGDSKLKIAYAPSMGVTKLQDEDKLKIATLVKRLNAVSVREKQSIPILQELGVEDVTFVLDPVLLLDNTQWDTIVDNHIFGGEEPYIYYYAHGNVLKNVELANKIFASYNLRPISTPILGIQYGAYNCLKTNTSNIYDVGPAEFINLIKHAEVIVTESFHATVLSILYNKQFIVLLRDFNPSTSSMNSRLYNLLELVHLEDRIVTNMESFLRVKDKVIDYSEVNEILARERNRSIEWLNKALHMTVE